MPGPVIELATVLLIFGAYFAFAFGLALLLGKFIAHGNARSVRAERWETDSSITSISEYIAEQERKANRATLAQRERWGRSA